MNLTIIQIAASLLRMIAEIGRSPALAAFPSAEKFGTVVADLAATAGQLIDRGEEGIEDLRSFTAKVSALRDRLNAGDLPPDEFVAEIYALKARSDEAHAGLQALKPETDTTE